MDASVLAGTAGIVLVILAIAFAVASLVMPFLVWSMHSQLREMNKSLSSVESELSQIQASLDLVAVRLGAS